MNKYEEQLARTNRNLKIVVVLCILIGGTGITYVMTDGFVNNPFEVTPTTTTPSNATVTVQQGVKVTGTAIYANSTPITSQSIFGLDANNDPLYIAAITNGAFTSNRGPAEGGLHDFYVSISGTILYVGTFDIPSADTYDQESVNIGTIKVYTTATTYTVQLIGETSNSFSSGGSAGTTNYTQSAAVSETYTLRITNTHDYSTLYRDYTDPRDDIVVEPVLWIEITATNVYPIDPDILGVQYWSDATKTYVLVPVSSITAEGTQNIALTWNFELNFPSAGTFAFAAYIVDGSSMAHLLTAKTRVANPATGETITNTQVVDAYCIVT